MEAAEESVGMASSAMDTAHSNDVGGASRACLSVQGSTGQTKALVRHRRSFETNSPGRARSNKKRRCLIPLSEETAATPIEAPNVHISALPTDVLVKIFGLLDPKLQRFVLPLVCHQWHEILAKPLGLWNHLDIDFLTETEEIIPGSNTKNAHKIRESRVIQWVKPRAAAVKSIRMRGNAGARQKTDAQLVPVSNGSEKLHDFTGNGVAKLLLTVASPLEELVIECCQDILTDITFIAMSRLPNLTVLCLKGICMTLSEQDFCAIASLSHLQELVLDCEQPPEVEEGVEEIKWGLQNFPEGMLHLTNMTHLTLTCHYGITHLPEGLSKLNKLEVLNMDFCSLTKLPPSLGMLTALTTLDVEGNIFLGDTFAQQLPSSPPSFPQELAGLKALRYLNLNSCGLSQVPLVVSCMTALETLDLENNELGQTEFPEGGMAHQLAALGSVQCLNLAQNMLIKLPDIVVDFRGLRILDLTNNNLTNAGIPSSLTRLSRLKAIGLKKNNLSRVPPVLGSMHSLQEIYLENNPTLEVEASLDFIAKLPNLRILMMGKQEGGWGPASMHFMADLSAKLRLRHPEKDILRISFPGHEPEALPDEAYQTLM